MPKVRFTKMHGIGNDYIYINCMESVPENLHQLSVEMSDRHKGVGGDGIILILPSDEADFRMRIFNADGSEAKMCGNGIRCVARYVHDKRLTDKRCLTIDTLSGIKEITVELKGGQVDRVRVDMGEPVLSACDVPVKYSEERMIEAPVHAGSAEYRLTAVSMGNPHGVIYVDDLAQVDVHGSGRQLEIDPMWPDRANIEFAEVVGPDEVQMRVWERGSGETMACGTGACAVAVAGAITGRTGRKVQVHLLGGDLEIEWGADNHVYMTGPATTVFEGEYERQSPEKTEKDHVQGK